MKDKPKNENKDEGIIIKFNIAIELFNVVLLVFNLVLDYKHFHKAFRTVALEFSPLCYYRTCAIHTTAYPYPLTTLQP